MKHKRRIKKSRSLVDVHKANRFEQWFRKKYPPFRPPQLECGKTYANTMCFIGLMLRAQMLGAFRKKPSNRFLKKKAMWEEKYGKYIPEYNGDTVFKTMQEIYETQN